ncbi:hypothetical protein F5880DRAFT_1526176 [Lentinula raphanica]|nr:hypothetical protein F5880DRAFT_1526176 [Lentinula raphanica]
MRLSASSFFTSRRLALSLCFFSSIAVMVIAWIPIDPQLSGAYPIYLSEILDKEGQSTGMRFIEINDARFGKERTVLQRQLPTSPPKVIGSNISGTHSLRTIPSILWHSSAIFWNISDIQSTLLFLKMKWRR